jgi:hypothetical protein
MGEPLVTHMESMFASYGEKHRPMETWFVCLVEITRRQETIDGETLSLVKREIKQSFDFATYWEARQCEENLRYWFSEDDYKVSENVSYEIRVMSDTEKASFEFVSSL